MEYILHLFLLENLQNLIQIRQVLLVELEMLVIFQMGNIFPGANKEIVHTDNIIALCQ